MVTNRTNDPRAGWALLATLWICVGAGALTWLISLSAREAIGAARNRVALTTAMGRAQACIAFAREKLRDVLSSPGGPPAWDHIDRVLAQYQPQVSGCTLSARPVGAHLNVNASDEPTLSRVFQAAGWRASRADSAAAALADWMDADDQPRPGGAERDWYVARDRIPPSNSPFVDVRELRRVRGLENWDRLESLFDVTPGPLALNQAPAELLSLLPGFTERTVQEVLATRADSGVTSFLQLRAWLDPDQPEASAKLPGVVVLSTSAWVVTARTRAGFPPVTVATEVRLWRSGVTTSIGFRRTWTE